MPFTIKTRSGDEVVLRFSEWVYALVGVCVFSLILSVTSLVIVLTHLDELGKRESETPPEASSPASSSPEESGGVPEEAESVGVTGTSLLPSPPSGKPGAEDRSLRLNPLASGVDLDELRNALSLLEKAPPTSTPAAVSSEEATGGSVEPGESTPDGDPDLRSLPVREPVSEVAIVPGESRLLPAVTPFFRWVLLSHLQGLLEEDGRTASSRIDLLALVAAHLHDPDPRVRVRASGCLLERSSAERQAEAISDWIVAARSWIAGSTRGDRLLEEVAERGTEPDVTTLPWGSVNLRAREIIRQEPGLEALHEWTSSPQAAPVDLVLALDVSESMETSFAVLRREVDALGHHLEWSSEDLRLGILFYRDEIVGTLDLDATPRERVEHFETLEAEGGGDVPEGVYEALRGCLELGRFSWRPGAEKHVVVVGDAACRREKLASLASLARIARRDADFTIHAVGVDPEEGFDIIPGFPPLARAGGGESHTIPASALVSTLQTIVFPPASRSTILGSLRSEKP